MTLVMGFHSVSHTLQDMSCLKRTQSGTSVQQQEVWSHVTGKEQHHALIYAGKLLGRKALGGPIRHQVEHEPAMGLCSKENE